MKITLLKQHKGMIHGIDPKRIECASEGTLTIGHTQIAVAEGVSSILPQLFYGGTGVYKASFTDKSGRVYELEPVTVKGGRIQPPPPTSIEILDLRCRAEEADADRDKLREKITELENIFDTNSLNFIIKGEETK